MRKVVLDFDGVLADSFEMLYTINKLSAEQVKSSMSPAEYRGFFGGKLHEQIKIFLGQDNEQFDKFSKYKYQIFPKYYNSKTVKLFEFSQDLIKNISQNAEIDIVSTAPKEVIIEILKANNLVSYFHEIHGNEPMGKRNRLNLIAKESNSVFFVTDTVGDILEAEGSNIKSVAVTWGFHSREYLKTVKPDFISSTPLELIDILKTA